MFRLHVVVHPYSDPFGVFTNVGSAREESTLETNGNVPTQSFKLVPEEEEFLWPLTFLHSLALLLFSQACSKHLFTLALAEVMLVICLSLSTSDRS